MICCSVRWCCIVYQALLEFTALDHCLYFCLFAWMNMLTNKQCASLVHCDTGTLETHILTLGHFHFLCWPVASNLLVKSHWHTLKKEERRISGQSQAAKLSTLRGQWSVTRANFVMSKFSSVSLLIASMAPIMATVCLSPNNCAMQGRAPSNMFAFRQSSPSFSRWTKSQVRIYTSIWQACKQKNVWTASALSLASRV